jgi:hypothetical protein
MYCAPTRRAQRACGAFYATLRAANYQKQKCSLCYFYTRQSRLNAAKRFLFLKMVNPTNKTPARLKLMFGGLGFVFWAKQKTHGH